MQIEIKEVVSKKDLSLFIDLPWIIYKNDPKWVAPLKMTLVDLFKENHPVWKTSTYKAWIAFLNKKPVGRIAAIINTAHNDYHQESVGFFGFYESIENNEVSKFLFDIAESYLRENNCKIARGPFNPSTNYECGLLINGYDDPPQLMMTYNPPYYLKQIETLNYKKAKDLLAYDLDLNFTLPEKILKVAARAEKSKKISYRTINVKKWDQEIDLMLEIYNSAWEKNWGFVPMSPEEFRHTAKDLKSILNPNFILFVMVDEKAAGFIVSLPDFNQVLKHIPSGKLLPTGIFKLLNAKKYINRVRVITLGIKSEYRAYGLASLLYKQTQIELRRSGVYTNAELSWVLEDNYNMNNPLILMGAKPYKTYRIFEKEL